MRFGGQGRTGISKSEQLELAKNIVGLVQSLYAKDIVAILKFVKIALDYDKLEKEVSEDEKS